MKKHHVTKCFALTLVLASACVLDEDSADVELETTYKLAANKLAANKLAANKLAANKLAANKLAANSLATTTMMATADTREVFSYLVECALPAGQSVKAKSASGVEYTFSGSLGLAPAWATRAPTVSERRWVTACLLARTNVYGVSVPISLRHDTNLALTTTAEERQQFSAVEGAFFGDLFATPQTMYACGNRAWAPYAANSLRMCALSSDGVTTDCNFTYVGSCATACTDGTAPFNLCRGGAVSHSEVITINLTPTQQQ